MSSLRFHHVFLLLMLASFVSAFLVRPEHTARLQPQVASLFSPIAKPLDWLGASLSSRWRPAEKVDTRPGRVIREENELLKITNASLAAQLAELQRINADREGLGHVRDVSRPFAVIARDSGNRESLSINGSSLQGLKLDQPVVFIGGLVGRVSHLGVADSKVRLITDKGFTLGGRFGRFMPTGQGTMSFVTLKLSTATVSVEGAGGNQLVVDKVPLKDVADAGLQPSDWLVLDDTGWPANLQGYKIGVIHAITPRTDQPLFARIVIEPAKKLKFLNDVSVVVK